MDGLDFDVDDAVIFELPTDEEVGRRYLSAHPLEAVLNQDNKNNNTKEEARSSRRPEQPTITRRVTPRPGT